MTRFRIAVLLFTLTSLDAFALTGAERRQVVDIVAHLLETLYVIPEKGNELASAVRNANYESATTPSELAAAINRDLASANDRHLGMRFSPDRASTPVLTLAAWTERRAAMRSAAPMERPADKERMRLVNFGVRGAEVLEGNIGYLNIAEFMSTDETRAALSSAMALLSHTDAMIVDVRNCPGGGADTVSYLASYFFEPGKRALMTRHHRPSNTTRESTTVDVPGRRRPDVDLYILTGPKSASGCESFAFTLQQWGRAKTVGEKTAGAGHNNMIVDVGLGLRLSISVGSAKHPKTGKAFEAVGVQPDIAVAADRALEAARAEALRKLSRAPMR